MFSFTPPTEPDGSPLSTPVSRRRTLPLLLGLAALSLGLAPQVSAQETVGGGTVTSPASGPAPSFTPPNVGNLVLVKNWHFGTGGTIKNYADMNANFLYHDQHNNIANGNNAYGALTVAPDDANALFPSDVYYYDDDGTHQGRGLGTGQPIEGRDSAPVRQFTADSLKTFLTPLSHASTYVNGVLTVLPDRHEVGNGSFMANWFLPAGGSLLGQDIVWETKVRYVTPPYFWFSLWTDGNNWNNGAEHDLVESYGEDYASEGAGTAHGNTNFDGHLWHANSVNGSDTVNYFTGDWWGGAMAGQGITSYDATQYHIWTWVYRHDNSYAMYVDGRLVQNGTNYNWTVGTGPSNYPINMDFRFDASWGHLAVKQVDKPLAASALAGSYYEFAYSHVYLSQPYPYSNPVVSLPGTVKAVNYESGDQGVAYNQGPSGAITLYRPDNSGADYGTALGWTAAGQWYKYKVNATAAGTYKFSFQAGSGSSGTFHVEDETGRNLTGTVTVPNTGGTNNFTQVVAATTATLSAGAHTLKWVQDTGGYDLYCMTVTAAPSAAISGLYYIVSRATGQVAEDSGYSTAEPKRLSEYARNGGTNQQWQISQVPAYDGSSSVVYSIKNAYSTYVFDADSGGTASGTAVNQYEWYPANGGQNQEWQFVPVPGASGYYTIFNYHASPNATTTGECLDVDTGSNLLQLYQNYGYSNQQWQLVPAP